MWISRFFSKCAKIRLQEIWLSLLSTKINTSKSFIEVFFSTVSVSKKIILRFNTLNYYHPRYKQYISATAKISSNKIIEILPSAKYGKICIFENSSSFPKQIIWQLWTSFLFTLSVLFSCQALQRSKISL